MLQLHVVWLFP
uniref:Uncharacterized protein n=1 Tax=Arundo donax TaxID=35708 RepID=A0A0A9A1B4_ARUDO